MSVTGGEFVVTAAGAVSAAGHTPRAIREALIAGRTVGATPADDAIAIEAFDPRQHLARKGLLSMSRPSQLAAAAAAQLATSLAAEPAEGVGVVVGTRWAALETVVEFEHRAHLDGARFVDPLLFTETVANVAAGQISILFGWSALNVMIADDAAAGLTAIEQALALLGDERATTIVAGGVDALHGHQRGIAQPDPSLRHGEGAALIAIASARHARERGHAVLGTIAAVIPSSALDPEAAASERSAGLLAGLLVRAGWSIEDLDLLILSGAAARELPAGTPSFRGQSLFIDRVLGRTWAASIPLGIVAALDAMQVESPRDVPIQRAAVVLADPEGGYGAVALCAAGVDDGR